MAASLARRMSSPVRAGVPAVLVGILTAALAWPGIPAAAWVTAITVLVLLVIHALTLDRNRPERRAPDPDPAWSWSGRSDGPITIALLFGGRVVRSILVGTFDVPVPAAVGFVGVAAAATRCSSPSPREQPERRKLRERPNRRRRERRQASAETSSNRNEERESRPPENGGRLSASREGARGLRGAYSHSMVPGGLDVMSRTTRLTSATSLVMRVEMRSSTS
ncbi:hypothetical protein ACH0BR_05005 [Corynebacterium xerosis]